MSKIKLIVVGVFLALHSSGVVYAQQPKLFSPLTISASAITTDEADVATSNQSLQRDTWIIDAKYKQALGRQWSLGFDLSYASLNYDWKVKQQLFDSVVTPWSDLTRYSAGISLAYRPDKHWMFMMAPKIQYAYADVAGVSSSDAMSYGLVAAGMYRFEDGNMLGFGVAYLNDISKVRTVPYLAVRWQINERFRLGNPFSAGFSGPAGLELTYQASPIFDIGLGTSKRTQRFLIQDQDITVEVDEWVSFVRAGWLVSDSITLNGYAGYYFDSEMELSEPELIETLDNQVAFALAAEYKF
ncbi:DUF6268 family outer membrane beta-barrel protein [Shewanella sp. UCD-KL12]|uniref:DUF6268 family outer membrane beta-barrel protein n=1 Tax=Shewanella sp. UCD-KL12 TaxID=1917163 RepID=UPI000970535F|nr:DUF6268 family outer membrane beta-barrel protein [Shewanella sp. UCD-KL12]